jgi:flagellar hook protein FlgE
MGLFGALFAGVSGLDSQSNKIGIISNNISNVNTVGYKQGQSLFDTLVVPSGTTSFSPGGVIGGNQQLVDQQGVISATTSPTDIAISGGGMLFVSSSPTGGTSNQLFTRAGSFTQDANGNFINSNGYYLQGIPIDSTTGLAEPFSDLTTVNVSSSATGKPTPTSTMALGANFNASQTALLGPGETITSLAGVNNGSIPANQIIVGNDVNGENGNLIKRGDAFNITDSASTNPIVFTYGGFAIGRNVTTTFSSAAGSEAESTAGGGLGDGNNILDTEAGATIDTTSGSNVITLNVTNLAAYQGTYASISGVTTNIGTLTPADLNGEWQIVPGSQSGPSGIGTVQVELASGSLGDGSPGTATVSNRTDAAFTGNIFNAKSATDDFLSGIDVANTFTDQALDFSISVNGNSTKFVYNANPNPSAGTFNSMDTLVAAINDATGSGLTAQVTDNRLYISATNPNELVSFTNGDSVGTPNSSPPLAGINWTQELDLPATITPAAGVTYFNSLQSLANAVNNAPTADNLIATVTDPTGASTLSLNETNAQQSITFTDGNGVATNTGSLLGVFGFQNLTGTAPSQAVTIAQTYNASDPTKNMSSGSITPQFTKDITIYDSLGQSHTIAMNVAKIDTGTWAVEFTSVPPGDVLSADGSSGSSADGQIASGIVSFNSNGVFVPNAGSAPLESISVNWSKAVGASPSSIAVNLGQNTITSATSGIGLTQAAGAFNVSTVQQNGSPTGELTGVNIDANGFVIASFSNGQTQKMFQLPLANFTDPNGLLAVSGNAYQATLASGPVNPEFAGTSGVGTFTPSALEQSNVDLSTQLTDLIVAQQAYGANSKVLTVADTLLQELDQIIQ